jgi:hypothetical protein
LPVVAVAEAITALLVAMEEETLEVKVATVLQLAVMAALRLMVVQIILMVHLATPKLIPVMVEAEAEAGMVELLVLVVVQTLAAVVAQAMYM